jgi:predicted Zn-dependent protease
MKKASLLFLFFLLVATALPQAADFNNYTPIRSVGELPKEFSSSSLEKYQEAAKKISANKTKIEKEALRDYELESSYAIDDIFHSGKVIFNDTISNYVNAVMGKLMEHREKKKNVRVYVLRSSVVNAFATGKGIIFVTMGLLARLNNEAELAYILSHEYIHYLKKHSINEYIDKTKARHRQGQYRNGSIDDKYLKRANFSKEQELEADELGFELFCKTKYGLTAPVSALNTILYHYLPFEERVYRFGKPQPLSRFYGVV